MRKIQSKLFTDPDIHYPIDNLNLSFDDYIKESTKLITQCRVDLYSPHAQDIIAANAPFEFRPEKLGSCGALLIHGLLDSPFSMKEIGLHLQSQGILSRAIVLPGHTTVPGALLNTDYHQWLQAVHYGITSLAKEVKHIFLIGFSTGASVALLHTLQNQVDIAGIILLSPVLKIYSPFAALSQIFPRNGWFYRDKNETSDYARYRSIPFNAIYQVYRLTQAIKKEKPSPLPLLFALSQEDNTVCSRTTLSYFKQQLHPKNHLILYSNTQTKNNNPCITLRSSIYPEKYIRGFSHLALPISPNNLHYGEKNNSDHTAYGEFNPLQISFNAFLFKLKLSQYYYRRLMFNPDFDFLLQSIDQFIRTVLDARQ
ncbi:MAG: Thermostable monoacylglycerol lipase [Gammaproteobacteria bacterium]|jgi:esterase/lipase|nr:Thermostable monoacylglycerol lipase [Gammaproteobacteria bacterium]